MAGIKDSTSEGLYLHWEGKRSYRQHVPTPRLLEPVAEFSTNVDSQNMIIEGDNLQVLASLASRYEGSVDVIYIDPPYNLGKDDFRYSDKRFHDPDADSNDAVYVSNEDGGRHTKWLNFMASRLWMLKRLLRDQGVIFVSINDVELFRLGLLLDEIFDERNRVGILVWKGITDNNPTNIVTEHEYVLCYTKSRNLLPPVWSSRDNEVKQFMLSTYAAMKGEGLSLAQLQRKFLSFAKENKNSLGDLYRYRKIDERAPYVARRNLDNPGKPGHQYEVIHPVTKKPCRKPVWGWRFSEDSMRDLIARGRIIFGKDEIQIPQLKVYLDEVEFPLRSVIELYSGAGSNDLEKLFGRRDVFKSPKPVDFIEQLLSFTTTKESLVLDAFAGSGTTAHAVLDLNQKDGGTRRFILIEDGNGNDKFCRTLTAERVKLAIERYHYNSSFAFYRTGRKLDRQAIVSLKREALANLICQADETGRGRGIVRVSGCKYIIGRNYRGEAICLVWNGEVDSEVTKVHLKAASQEVTEAGLKRPFRIYGTHCTIANTSSWRFCQIPDEIMAQMHIREEDSSEGSN